MGSSFSCNISTTKVDTLANNVANANTPGFKKTDLTFREHLTVLENGASENILNKTWSPEDFYHTMEMKAHIKTDGSYTNQPRTTIPTGNIYDLAIKGHGFLKSFT